jgi:hypothetical protein
MEVAKIVLSGFHTKQPNVILQEIRYIKIPADRKRIEISIEDNSRISIELTLVNL